MCMLYCVSLCLTCLVLPRYCEVAPDLIAISRGHTHVDRRTQRGNRQTRVLRDDRRHVACKDGNIILREGDDRCYWSV